MTDEEEQETDLSIAIVVARLHERVSRRLLRGAEDALKARGIPDPDVYWVPTPLDIPVLALALAEKGGPDAIVALGCLVADDIAAVQVAAGVMQVQLDTGVPISLGVVNVDELDHAMASSGPTNNRGGDAADGAVEMANLLREVQG